MCLVSMQTIFFLQKENCRKLQGFGETCLDCQGDAGPLLSMYAPLWAGREPSHVFCIKSWMLRLPFSKSNDTRRTFKAEQKH